jgi:hypothetical protein
MTEITEYQFLVYLLVYAAHVDNCFSIEEKTLIESHFGVSDTFKMLNIYNDLSISARDSYIVDHIEFFSENLAIKAYMTKLLKELYNVDGEFCRYEQSFDKFVKKLFEHL